MTNPFRTQIPPPNTNNSALAKAVSSITASHSSAASTQNQLSADRQSALLSLLGSTGSCPESAPLPYPPQSYGPFPADAYQAQYTQEPSRDFQPQAPQAQPQPHLSQSQVHAARLCGRRKGHLHHPPTASPPRLGCDRCRRASQQPVARNHRDTTSLHGRPRQCDARGMAKLCKEAARVKTILSTNTEASATVKSVAFDVDYRSKITRAALETACADMKPKFAQPIFDTLANAGLALDDITSVILTGGHSRVSMVQAAVRAAVGESKIATSVNVDEAAVLGAALYGVSINRQFHTKDTRVTDILLVCIVPSNDFEPLHSVKWHPKDLDTLAVASDSNIYLLNVADAANVFRGIPFTQDDLRRVAQIFTVASPLISFDFDIPHQALATISEDSVLTLWNVPDKLPFWSQKISGEGVPSSLIFLDGGVVIGRKNGTVFQLLPVMGEVILSTVKFVNGGREDPDMFGHVTYDSRIQTLWVANSKRDSLIALKVCFELSTPSPGGEELIRGGYFEQLVEFVGPKPTLNFFAPGELALIAFSVHSSGVDQVLIRKGWYEAAFVQTTAKFPPFSALALPPPPPVEARRQQRQQVVQSARVLSQPIPSVPIRLRTPPSEEVELEHGKDETRQRDVKSKGTKGKNVGWKDREEANNGKGKEKAAAESAILNEWPLGVALSKEIRKVEENLHTRIGRLIAKELDKQQQRLEDTRANEQAADFARQEKTLKLISTELTKNTTRVVEAAVKGEVQNSSLPPEVERMFIKPDVSNQITRNLSNSLSPVIERQKTLIPAYQAQSSAMHQDISREIRTEITSLKKGGQLMACSRYLLDLIRDMDQAIRTLSEQVKFMTMNMPTMSAMNHPSSSSMPSRTSPGSSSSAFSAGQSPMGQQHHRSNNLPPMGSSYPPSYQQAQAPPPSSLHKQCPLSQQMTQQSILPTPPAPKTEEWDDTYLAVLGTQDLKQLRELLARSNPEAIMPSNGAGPLSQAVILTLVHRLAAAIGETSPVEEAFKASPWWLQRASTTLNTNDPLIFPGWVRPEPAAPAARRPPERTTVAARLDRCSLGRVIERYLCREPTAHSPPAPESAQH
ncbi:hypothetical protein DFH11DRAFT_1691777 [Phellopilus nigrolimitatus]|nr:hypothetical protein DFH11DRAFT_1691777 [Phellopilus nigrolimitatus]